LEAPAVILLDMAGRNRTYEVYINGEVVSRESTVNAAKQRAEKALGACAWEKRAAPKQVVDHYYFGLTDEFGAPANYYVGHPV